MRVAAGMLEVFCVPRRKARAVADTGTYLTIVLIGFVITLVVGQLLMRSGHGFLRDVFESEEVATSTTRLLGVLFHLVALGFLAVVSTANFPPVAVAGTAQLVVTKIGGVLLMLGILHGATLLLLSRVRNRRRSQSLEESMTGQYSQRRQSRQSNTAQVIEAGGNGGSSAGSPR